MSGNSVVVYGFRGSPYVEKVVAALQYKKIPWSIEMMKTPAAVKRLNPTTQKMPAIKLNGVMFYDSTFILRELEQFQSIPSLWPDTKLVAAQQRLLEDWCDESLYWYIMAIRWQKDNANKAIAQITSAMPRVLGWVLGYVLKKKLTKTTWAQGLGRLPRDVLARELSQLLEDLSFLLADSPFFFSAQPSAADFSVYGQIRFGMSGTTPDFEVAYQQHENLQQFYRRIETLLE